MKMQSTVYAASDGAVEAIFAQVGETVASKDLLVQLRPLSSASRPADASHAMKGP
jgi:pyruvate/2-oxoglutarate dehydrogenase complex dihydrolipoamide acyltransferase (E2) component